MKRYLFVFSTPLIAKWGAWSLCSQDGLTLFGCFVMLSLTDEAMQKLQSQITSETLSLIPDGVTEMEHLQSLGYSLLSPGGFNLD